MEEPAFWMFSVTCLCVQVCIQHVYIFRYVYSTGSVVLSLIRCNYTIHSFLLIFSCVFITVLCQLASIHKQDLPHRYQLLAISKKNVSASDQERGEIYMHSQASKCRHTQNNPGGTFYFSLNIPLSRLILATGEHPQTQFLDPKFSLVTQLERQEPEAPKAGR